MATVKTELVRELSTRIAISGGPEVFRRLLLGAPVDLVNTALQELVTEGWLKRTELRVGSVYHYPPNQKSSQEIVNKALSGEHFSRGGKSDSDTEEVSAAEIAAFVPPVFERPTRARKRRQVPAVERAYYAAKRSAKTGGTKSTATGAAVATGESAEAPVFKGPVKARKRTQLTPDEVERSRAAREGR